MSEATYRVEGMNCSHCELSVTKALESVPGVSKADVSLERGEAKVSFTGEPVDTTVLVAAVEGAGYTLKPAS